jgi:hypothetical protein
MSEVTRSAASASVRASTIVGTTHAVGGKTRGDELLDGLAGGHEDLAAHVTALLHRGELVLEVHACGARLDHRLHQLERIEHPAESASASATIGAK